MYTILKSYLKKLTNLSGSNRSLLLLRLSADQDLDLHELDFLNGDPSFSLMEKLIAGKKSIRLCQNLDSRNDKINEIGKTLKKIHRRDKFIFEERGGKDLYVGWPFVRGKFSDGTLVRSPLLFFPVSLELKDNEWFLELRKDVSISFNKSFLLAYSHFNEIPLSDDFLETSFEDSHTDSQVFRTELYQLLKAASFEVNFNQEIFINRLHRFESFKKEEYDERHNNGELKLFPEGVLGIFPQAGSYLVPDYDYLIKNNLTKDLEEFFYRRSVPNLNEKPGDETNFITQVKEEHTFTPFKLDTSQENALKAVKKGKSIVVQGPPGTGKSQMICNLISDFIVRGKNVLLVCQKRAALDVVYERLNEKGLDDFVGLVHDFKNDRKIIFDQVNHQVEKLEEYKFRNSSLDAIYLERKFVQTSRVIDQITEDLEEFKKALFDEKECGISVKELYLSSDPTAPTIDVNQEYSHFKMEEMEKFTRLIHLYFPYAFRFEKSDYIWNDRVSFKDFTASHKNQLLDLLDHIPFYQTNISESIREILGASLDMEDFQWFLDRQEQIGQLLHLLEDAKTYSSFIYLLNKNTDQDWLIIKEKKITECFKGSGIEKSLSTDQLGPFQAAFEKARRARGGLFKWLKWKMFSKDKYLVKRVFVANNLHSDKEGFAELVKRLDNRMNFEHNLTELKECGWFQSVPEVKEFEVISDWIHHQQAAMGTKTILKDLRSLKDYLNIPSLSYSDLKLRLSSLLKILKEVPEERNSWMKILTSRQVSQILEAFDYAIDLAEVLRKDFESLVEFDKMKSKLLPHEKSIIEKLVKKSNGFRLEDTVNLFENSIRLEWIESIELKYPILRSVSSLKMEQMEKELQESIEEKLKVSREIVLMRVRERAYKNVEFNRLDNRVTYRELHHQVTKKRKIWPIRKVISEFSEELFQLIPCWMASPESVSAIFPMSSMFDLVIFDEASQCYAEKGIPSIFRGKQVVITGDDKQLSPSDFYQVRWDDDTLDIPELEVDSLLDLGKKYLSEVKLTGHYRSKSLDLIEFSNSHFYNGELALLPDFSDMNSTEPSIRYIKVDGRWKKNTNKKEAEEVVHQIKDLLSKYPEKSIGVVTFNYNQQILIQDMIEQEVKGKIPESLFVKNIENVQGDERDIIVFSIGYARDEYGKMAMQFGSLNMEKGENRLNVAITRAKEKIIVITSILPQELKVEELKHEGPKYFKKYLQYAYNVSEGIFAPQPRKFTEFKSKLYLKKELQNTSMSPTISLQEELPFADLTVKNKNLYAALIQTDDDIYFQTKSVKELHAYLPLSMKSKNWKYKKIFSRNYWENKNGVKEELVKYFGDHV